MNYKNKLCSQDFHLDALPLSAGYKSLSGPPCGCTLRCTLGSVVLQRDGSLAGFRFTRTGKSFRRRPGLQSTESTESTPTFSDDGDFAKM